MGFMVVKKYAAESLGSRMWEIGSHLGWRRLMFVAKNKGALNVALVAKEEDQSQA